MFTKSSPPLVSIGIPTYNRIELLRRALDSVVNQTYGNIEIIISDNASTDATSDYCLCLEKTEPRIKYIRQSENIGPTRNFQQVLAIATGEFFMWLGDDDWISSNYISVCVEFLTRNEDYSLAAGRSVYFRSGNPVCEETPTLLDDPQPDRRVIKYYSSVSRNGEFYGLIRTAYLKQLPINTELASDWNLVAAIVSYGKLMVLNDIYINRSLGGGTNSRASILKVFGIDEWYAHSKKRYYVTVARSVFYSLAFRHKVFARHCGFRRFPAAWASVRGILRRQSIGMGAFIASFFIFLIVNPILKLKRMLK